MVRIKGSDILRTDRNTINKTRHLIIDSINDIPLSNDMLVNYTYNGLMSSTDKIKLDSIIPDEILIGVEDRISINGNTIDISPNYSGQSSIHKVGTLTSGSLGSTFGIIDPYLGGTGVPNSSTITLGGNLITSDNLMINNEDVVIDISKSGTLAMTTDLNNYSGTINRITVIDNQIDIASNYSGQSSITTVGELSSGSFASTFGIINPYLGGTGVSNHSTITIGGDLIINNQLTINTPVDISMIITKDGVLAMTDDLNNYSGTIDRITITNNNINIANNYSGQSSITTVGTLTSGTLGSTFETIDPQIGGTGISNSSTITLGGNLVINDNLTINGVNATITIPKSGTVAMIEDLNNYSGAPERIDITGVQIDISDNYSGQSSITTVGELIAGSLGPTFEIIEPQLGGTGVSNTSTISLDSDLSLIGPGPMILNSTGITDITLPTNGIIATTDNMPILIGTEDRIDINNNVVDIHSNYSGQKSINTVGTLTSGSLGSNSDGLGFTPVPISKGGTGKNFSNYTINKITEIIPNDLNEWTNTGQCVRFNKGDFDNYTRPEYKFIVSSAQRTDQVNKHSGGFRIYDRSNQQIDNFPANVYDKVGSGTKTDLVIRYADLHGPSSTFASLANLSFNAYYDSTIPSNDPDIFDIYEVRKTTDSNPSTIQRFPRHNYGASVFNWSRIEWGYNLSNIYGISNTAKAYHRTALGSDVWTEVYDFGVSFITLSLHGADYGTVPSNQYYNSIIGISSNLSLYIYSTWSNASNIRKQTIIDLESIATIAPNHSNGFVACWVNKYFIYAVNTNAPGSTSGNPTYGTSPDFTARIVVFGPFHNIIHKTDITGITIFGIALEYDKLILLSSRGLVLYKVTNDELIEQFTKPFGSDWISSYEYTPNNYTVNPQSTFFEFPIDIYKNEILVGSQSENKVFLINISDHESDGILYANDTDQLGLLPKSKPITFNDYIVSEIVEIIPNDTNEWTNTGQYVRFNKGNLPTELPSRYKFIVSSAQSSDDAREFKGGFRVYDRNNKQAISLPASVYNNYSADTTPIVPVVRNCDIHGYNSRILITTNVNAVYSGIALPDTSLNTRITYNEPTNTDNIVSEYQAGINLGQPTAGVSVFHWLMVTWGYGSNTAKIWRRNNIIRVHLPDQGSQSFDYRNDFGRVFIKFVMNAYEGSRVFACGLDTSGQFIMYKFDSAIAGSITSISSAVNVSINAHIACSMYPNNVQGYYVYANGSIINVYNESYTLITTENIFFTIHGISIEENRLVILTEFGLLVSEINGNVLRDILYKPFDSTWISSYTTNHSCSPIDIFNNEILVGSSVINKVFLIKLDTPKMLVSGQDKPEWNTVKLNDLPKMSNITTANDTNITLNVSGREGLLKPITLTAGWRNQLLPERGGTGVNNAYTMSVAGNFTSNGTIKLTGNATLPTSGTLAILHGYTIIETNGSVNIPAESEITYTNFTHIETVGTSTSYSNGTINAVPGLYMVSINFCTGNQCSAYVDINGARYVEVVSNYPSVAETDIINITGNSTLRFKIISSSPSQSSTTALKLRSVVVRIA